MVMGSVNNMVRCKCELCEAYVDYSPDILLSALIAVIRPSIGSKFIRNQLQKERVFIFTSSEECYYTLVRWSETIGMIVFLGIALLYSKC